MCASTFAVTHCLYQFLPPPKIGESRRTCSHEPQHKLFSVPSAAGRAPHTAHPSPAPIIPITSIVAITTQSPQCCSSAARSRSLNLILQKHCRRCAITSTLFPASPASSACSPRSRRFWLPQRHGRHIRPIDATNLLRHACSARLRVLSPCTQTPAPRLAAAVNFAACNAALAPAAYATLFIFFCRTPPHTLLPPFPAPSRAPRQLGRDLTAFGFRGAVLAPPAHDP